MGYGDFYQGTIVNIKNQAQGSVGAWARFLFLWQNSDQNQLWEEGLISTCRLLSILRGSQAEAQSRILESETEAETIEKCVFLACSTCSLKLFRPTCPSSTVGWTSVTHSQTLGREPGEPQRKGGKIIGARGIENTRRRQLQHQLSEAIGAHRDRSSKHRLGMSLS